MQRQNQKWRERYNREIVLQKVEREHAVFKQTMLAGTVHEVYEYSRRICFYENVREYFLYQEASSIFLEAAVCREKIIGELWELYLKNEYLRTDTWEEIEIILQVYAEKYTQRKQRLSSGDCRMHLDCGEYSKGMR